VFISVYVETKPTNARIINLTALGRFRLEISCACTEFKFATLGDGPVVKRIVGLAGILPPPIQEASNPRKSVRERRSA
jgi:hypothetical protein